VSLVFFLFFFLSRLLENPEGYERFIMMAFLNLNALIVLSVGTTVSLPLKARGGPDGGCATAMSLQHYSD